jgi:hypothetical protein
MRDRPDHEWSKSGDLDSSVSCSRSNWGGPDYAGVDHYDIRLNSVGIDCVRDLARHFVSEDTRSRVIIG